MNRILGKIFDKITEFIARDFIYICSGTAMLFVAVSFIETLDPDLLPDLNNFSKFGWLPYLVALPFAHIIGFGAREAGCLTGLCTASILDPSKAFPKTLGTEYINKRRFVLCRFSFRKYLLDSNAVPDVNVSDEKPNYQGTNITTYVADFGDTGYMMDKIFGIRRNEFRSFTLYQRAIFLKESSGTMSSGAMVVSIILTIQEIVKYGLNKNITFTSLLWAFPMILAILLGKISFYQSFRQGHYYNIIARNSQEIQTLANNLSARPMTQKVKCTSPPLTPTHN